MGPRLRNCRNRLHGRLNFQRDGIVQDRHFEVTAAFRCCVEGRRGIAAIEDTLLVTSVWVVGQRAWFSDGYHSHVTRRWLPRSSLICRLLDWLGSGV
jgi:hypothetical protein